MKFEEWVKGIENAAIKGLCSTHPNICKMIYNEGQKDIEKALKDKGVCLQSEYDELKQKVESYERTRNILKIMRFINEKRIYPQFIKINSTIHIIYCCFKLSQSFIQSFLFTL